MHARGLLAALVFVAIAGCHIEHNEGVGGTDGYPICSSFCDRLVLCGSISESQISTCTSQCVGSYNSERDRIKKDHEDDDWDDESPTEENSVQKGCACVLSDVCKPTNAYNCPGAPLPPPSTGQGGNSSGQGGSSAQGGSSSSQGGSASAQGGSSSGQGGSGTGYACSDNHDCASGEDCIGGWCRLRCKASCQCHSGEVCEEGYCGVPSVPVVSCQSDCDCTAGQSCVSGACK